MLTIFKGLCRFRKDETGTVTIDWVVLTAALVAIAIAALVSVASGTTEAANELSGCAQILGDQMLQDPSARTPSWAGRMANVQNECATQ